jgi:hypothetical protein
LVGLEGRIVEVERPTSVPGLTGISRRLQHLFDGCRELR